MIEFIENNIGRDDDVFRDIEKLLIVDIQPKYQQWYNQTSKET